MTKTPSQPSKPMKQPIRTVRTLIELAAWCGISVKSVQNWKKEVGFPIESNGEYSPVRVAEWRLLRKFESFDGDVEADLAGPASPMLERYREERWRLAKLDRQEREGSMVSVAEIHGFVMTVASQFRNFGCMFQREFGTPGHQLWKDCLDAVKAETDRQFGNFNATNGVSDEEIEV